MSNCISNIAVVVLAAGASKRMGASKQLLKWGNDSLLTHTVQTVLKLKTNKVIVVLGANYKIIENEIKNLPVTILNNEEWEVGIGKSIACAINYIVGINSDIDGVLITLADQPFVNTKFLELMIQNYDTNQHSIIATSYEDGSLGVPVIFDKKYFGELSKLKHDKGAKIILKKHRSLVKSVNSVFKNIDIDFIEDYEKYKITKTFK